jgi:hypothetical protein
VLGRDTPIWKLERRCNAGYARREIRAAPSATRAGAVSLIPHLALKFWSRGTTRLLLSGPPAMVLSAVAVAIVGVVVLRGQIES